MAGLFLVIAMENVTIPESLAAVLGKLTGIDSYSTGTSNVRYDGLPGPQGVPNYFW